MKQQFKKIKCWLVVASLACSTMLSSMGPTAKAAVPEDVYDLEPVHYYSVDEKDATKELDTFYYDKDADKNEFYMMVDEYAYDRATISDESRMASINPFEIEGNFAWGSRCDKEDYEEYVTTTKIRTVEGDTENPTYTVYKIEVKDSFESILAGRTNLTMDMFYRYEDLDEDEDFQKDYEKKIVLINRSTEMLLRKANYDSGTLLEPYPDSIHSVYENVSTFDVGYHNVELSIGSLINLGLKIDEEGYEKTTLVTDFGKLTLLDEKDQVVQNGITRVDKRNDICQLFLPEPGDYILCYEADDLKYEVYITATLQALGFYEPINGQFEPTGASSFAYRRAERDSRLGQDYVVYLYAREMPKYYWSNKYSEFRVSAFNTRSESLNDQMKYELVDMKFRWSNNKEVFTEALMKVTIPSTVKGKINLHGIAGVTDGLSSTADFDLGQDRLLEVYDLATMDGEQQDEDDNKTTTGDTATNSKPAGNTSANSSGETTKKQNTSVVRKPARVTLISAKNNKKKTITIKIKAAKNAKKYKVQYATNKKFKKAKTFTTKSLTVVLKKLSKKKTYYIRICGVNDKSTGPWSKVKNVKVKK